MIINTNKCIMGNWWYQKDVEDIMDYEFLKKEWVSFRKWIEGYEDPPKDANDLQDQFAAWLIETKGGSKK